MLTSANWLPTLGTSCLKSWRCNGSRKEDDRFVVRLPSERKGGGPTGEPSIWEISAWELGLRMVCAVVLGGLVGLEREWSNHAAGFRTHILVCLGSATIMLLSIYGFSAYVDEVNVRVDPARLAAQVISGIGFLGAGAIMRNGNIITGLTTAASVWVVAAIGLCVGAGFMVGASICTLFVLISLFVLNKLEKHLVRHRREHEVTVHLHDVPGSLGRICSVFGECGIQIANLKMTPIDSPVEDDGMPVVSVHFLLKTGKAEQLTGAVEAIAALDIVRWLEASDPPAVKSGSGSLHA